MKYNTRKRVRGLKHKKSRGVNKSLSASSALSSASLKELGLAGSFIGASTISQGMELEENQNQNQNQSLGQQLTQSHNIAEDQMFGGGGHKSKCVNDIADHILSFLELLNTIKIYHWSTLSYPTHKATDELHSKLSELVDSFIEIYIGHCARGKGGGAGVPVFRFKSAKDVSISFCECKSLDSFCAVLDKNIIHLEGLTKKLDGYTDLVNIRDEMVGALAQALYLLRLH